MKISYSKLIYTFIVLYIILKPFYIWSSGLPQVSDMILVLLILFIFLKRKLNVRKIKKIYILLLFLLYIILINLTWIIVLNNYMDFMFSTFYYLFNIIVFLVFVELQDIDRNLLYSALYKGILISLVLQLILFLIFGDNVGREVGFFNNPNQLAYYSLLCLAIIFMIEESVKPKKINLLFIIIGYFILLFLSISKAAIMSGLLMFVFFSIYYKGDRILVIIFRISSFLMLAITYLVLTDNEYLYNISNSLDLLLYRINTQGGNGLNLLEGRGYDRIFNHKEYLIFGAGEGEFSRFDSKIKGLELHSTLGNILFSYGLIGFTLFISFIISIINKKSFYVLFSVLLYGLTHNGIRNTLLWILFAIIMSMGNKQLENSNVFKISVKS